MNRLLKKTSENVNIAIITGLILIILGLLFLPFIFIFSAHQQLLLSILLGWLLGGVLSIIAFFILVKQMHSLSGESAKAGVLGSVFSFLRLLIYASGLIVAAVLEYQFKIIIFNLFAVAASYLPLRFVIMAYKKKNTAEINALDEKENEGTENKQ